MEQREVLSLEELALKAAFQRFLQISRSGEFSSYEEKTECIRHLFDCFLVGMLGKKLK